MSRYRATVVDIVPGINEDQLRDCISHGYGVTIADAEAQAIEGSAVNCSRRVYVQEEVPPFVIVKGPYILRPSSDRVD